MTDIIRYPEHRSKTGSFQELVRGKDIEFGQLSILTIKPGCSRGGHFHKRKREWFCCLRGECFIHLTNTCGESVSITYLRGTDKVFMVVRPYETHAVRNLGNVDCETLIISSEEYSPEDTDTFLPGESSVSRESPVPRESSEGAV